MTPDNFTDQILLREFVKLIPLWIVESKNAILRFHQDDLAIMMKDPIGRVIQFLSYPIPASRLLSSPVSFSFCSGFSRSTNIRLSEKFHNAIRHASGPVLKHLKLRGLPDKAREQAMRAKSLILLR